MTASAQRQGRETGISLLRILATIAIILLHTCNTLTANPEQFRLSQEQTCFLRACYSMMGWGVPTFMMITGWLMLNKERKLTLKALFAKYCRRILIALFLFGVPFSMLEMVVAEQTFRIGMLWEGILRVLNGSSWGHLWYLYALIGFYLILPLLKLFTDYCSREVLRYLLIVIGVFTFLMPIIDALGFTLAFELPVVSEFVFYALLGCYLRQYGMRLTEKRLYACLLTAASLALIALLSCVDWSAAGPLKTLLCIPLMLGVFSLVKKAKVQQTERLWRLDRLCFGVYLIHPLFINMLYKGLGITPLSFAVLPLTVPLFWLLFTLLSFAASWLMSLISPLRKYVL